MTKSEATGVSNERERICDVCELKPSIGACCCGVRYCSITCQEAHLDESHEGEDEND